MTPKSFFMIVIRVIGIFMLINTLQLLPSSISSLSTMTMYNFGEPRTEDIGIVAIFVIAELLLLFAIVYFLLLKPEILVRLLKLDTGFEEKTFDLNFSQSSILKTAIIVIGGITLFWEIPNFIYDVFYFWQQKSIKWIEHPDSKNLIFSVALIVIAYLLIYYNGKIVAYIEKQSKEKE